MSAEEDLGLPYRVTKTPQEQGRKDEKRMAKSRGARVHPGSGSGRIKDDASNDTHRYEFKSVRQTHVLQGDMLLGLFKRAIRQDQEPEYVVYFKDADITATINLQRGQHG
jgi:hypothetical protein